MANSNRRGVALNGQAIRVHRQKKDHVLQQRRRPSDTASVAVGRTVPMLSAQGPSTRCQLGRVVAHQAASRAGVQRPTVRTCGSGCRRSGRKGILAGDSNITASNQPPPPHSRCQQPHAVFSVSIPAQAGACTWPMHLDFSVSAASSLPLVPGMSLPPEGIHNNPSSQRCRPPQMVRDRAGGLYARLHIGRDVSQEAWGSPRNPGTDRGSR
jgi:hypothetical protein